MRLRVGKVQDASAIARLHTASWRDTYRGILDHSYLAGDIEQERLEHWKSAFASPGDFLVTIAEERNRIVGFVCALPPDGSGWGALVDNLHVDRLARGKGIGRQLLRAAANWVAARDAHAPLYLWVFEDNRPAIAFYKRLGGKVAGRDISPIPAAEGAAILRMHWSQPFDFRE